MTIYEFLARQTSATSGRQDVADTETETASNGDRVAGENGKKQHRDQRWVVSVVVPTRNEQENIEPLVERLRAALPTKSEIIFVDDSDDDTPEVVERVRTRFSSRIRLIHRKPGHRAGGLGGAVIEGLRAARARWVCVMDADLQHPPELVAELVARVQQGDVDVVVASRYAEGGSVGEFSAPRRAISHLFNLSARLLFPRRLKGLSDPMSGFFIVNRDLLPLDAMRPNGFKILLEILAKTPNLRLGIVPLRFGTRHAGESKACTREAMSLLSQLLRLWTGDRIYRLLGFGLVGATGIAVNMLAFAAINGNSIHYVLAALAATQISTLWLFVLSDRIVFKGRAGKRSGLSRLAMYYAMNNAAFALRGPLLVVLVSGFGLNDNLGNFVSLLALTIARFAVADSLIWKGNDSMQADVVHSYDIHGIVTVQSDVGLPELERFAVPGLADRPTIRVRIGALSRTQSSLVDALSFAPRHIRYDEGLGRFGFAVDISMGKRTEIVASPLVRHSPHVLYTNIVEPVLRWTFARNGFALIHAACLSFDGDAVLVTAKTDTGKTTTILKSLDAYDCAFMSDDLTLLTADGRVMTYPKPLTVSRHTVAAVKAPMLTWRERLTLPLQSRLHSRSGRRFAMFLAKTKLPVATINTITQLIVPPPKYHVDRLIPDVRHARLAQLRHLVVIERAPAATLPLEREDAVETLVLNSEDAFGFPPYPTIASFLHGEGEADLHAAEQAVVRSALEHVSGMTLRSETMDWAERLPVVLGWETKRQEPRLRQAPGAPVGVSALRR